MVILDLEGSTSIVGGQVQEMDTLLGLYTGKDFLSFGQSNQSPQPTCNDDAGVRKTSRVLANVQPSDVYHIAVAGKRGSQDQAHFVMVDGN